MLLYGSSTDVQSGRDQSSGNISVSMPQETKGKYESAKVMNKMTIPEYVEMYWKFFFSENEKTPKAPLPQRRLKIDELLSKNSRNLKASWLGHSSLLINIDGYLILTDPVFEQKVSLVGPTRFNSELPLNIEDLPFVDVVIISHDHYDHLNKFSVQKLSGKTGRFIVPDRVGKRLVKWGIPEKKIAELGWWDEVRPNRDLTVVATPAQHFSGRGLFDRNNTLWASWVVQTPHHKIFFSGDTGYFAGFKEIGKKYGPFDVAFLECGAYDESWSNIHMLPEQTVKAFEDLGGKILQPIHWATFNLALHSWYEPIERLTGEAAGKSINVSTPIMGQIVDYSNPIITEYWWRPIMEQSNNKGEQSLVQVQLTADK
jgi:L-ascorbate metabolism protein UlaG (beta-lactamase superfamily)